MVASDFCQELASGICDRIDFDISYVKSRLGSITIQEMLLRLQEILLECIGRTALFSSLVHADTVFSGKIRLDWHAHPLHF